MKKFPCPNCKERVFSLWDKYRAAKWQTLRCPNCERRVVSQPLWLAGYYLLYLANVIDLGFLAYLTGNMNYIIAMVVIWILLDIGSMYLPLVAMRDSGSPGERRQAGDAAASGGAGVARPPERETLARQPA